VGGHAPTAVMSQELPVGTGPLTGRYLAALNGTEPLHAALAYAALGWPLFPVAPVELTASLHCGCKEGAACEEPGKHPLVHWTERATTDARQLRNWWRWQPHANLGVVTGQVSGLVVVDIDPHHEGDITRKALEAAGHAFPPTVTARTRSGGWHLFYRAPTGRHVANTTGSLAGVGSTPGIDVRADRGYIIVAPSVRPVAPGPDNGAPRLGRYEWVASEDTLAAAPTWVVVPRPPQPLAPSRPELSAGPGPDPTKRAAAALDAEARRVRAAGEGERNVVLFQAAANLFEICNTGWLDEAVVRAELTEAGLAAGLSTREVSDTLRAQWRRKQGVVRPGWPARGGGPGGAPLRSPSPLPGHRSMSHPPLTAKDVEGFGR